MFTLTDYIQCAMACAEYDKLEDNSFVGRIPRCKGVVAMAKSLRECEDELRSTLEEWVLVGLKLGHRLPVINCLTKTPELSIEITIEGTIEIC